MLGSQYVITGKAAPFASYPGRIRVLLVVVQTLTVLKVLEAFILDFELEWIDEQSWIVQHVHGRDVDGRHAALSGPGSLKAFDGTGPVGAKCVLPCLISPLLMDEYLSSFLLGQPLPTEKGPRPWRPLNFMKLDATEQGERPSSWLDACYADQQAASRCRCYPRDLLVCSPLISGCCDV